MLTVEGLASSYGRIEALHEVSFEVNQGEVVALVGSNGAGKTTLLKALSGVQPITAGLIKLEGEEIQDSKSHLRVAKGVAQVPEGRQIFAPLSVEDNLLLGAYSRPHHHDPEELDEVYEYFPILKDFRARQAGSLSGGQQQMLAIGRALMSRPKILLLDEPSMGLSPLLVEQIFQVIRDVRDKGVTILVVEQNVNAVLKIADRGYVLEMGKVTISGAAGDLLNDPRVQEAYLGV